MIDFIVNFLLNMTPFQEKIINFVLIFIGIIIFLITRYIIKKDEKKKSISYHNLSQEDKDLYYIWWHEEGLDLFNEWKKETGD